MVYIGVEQGNCGTIGRVLECGTNDLNHRRNASTARNQTKVTDEIGGIKEIALWSFDAKSVTYLHVSDVARDIAFFVSLIDDIRKEMLKRERKDFNNKGELATVIIVADRSVTPGNGFSINFCGNRNVLSSG